MTKQFGAIVDADPRQLSGQELQTLLTDHGVIAFRGIHLTPMDLDIIMSRIGPLQNYEEQQAPEEYSDPKNDKLIYLTNTDFLGRTRQFWHMDQTYLETPYLPIRSLYSPKAPEGINVTSFADVKPFTEIIEQEYPELLEEQGKYFISEKENKFSIRPIFSYCEHVKMKLLRLDARMQFVNDQVDIKKYFEIVKKVMDETPKFHLPWKAHDFVIFDNNQCPHKRSMMSGKCTLYRFTSTFWI